MMRLVIHRLGHQMVLGAKTMVQIGMTLFLTKQRYPLHPLRDSRASRKRRKRPCAHAACDCQGASYHHHDRVKPQQEADLLNGYHGASLPHALARKYPNVMKESEVQWAFPASKRYQDR